MDLDFKFDYNSGNDTMNILFKGEDGKFHAEYRDNFLFQADINLDLNVELTDTEKERLTMFINHMPDVDKWVSQHPLLTQSIENGTVRDDYANFSPEEKMISKLYMDWNED